MSPVRKRLVNRLERTGTDRNGPERQTLTVLSPGEDLSSVFITENWTSAGSERTDVWGERRGETGEGESV